MIPTARYFKQICPNIQDVVTAKITELSDVGGVYADCIEYPDIKLFISPTEIARRKVVNLRKFFSPDKLYPVLVLNVEANKNIVNVSYNKLKEDDKQNHLDKIDILQKIYKLGIDASKFYSTFFGTDLEKSTEYIFSRTIWIIFDAFVKSKTSANIMNEFYISLLENPSKLFDWKKNEYDSDSEDERDNFDQPVDQNFINEFVKKIKKRIKIFDLVLSTEITLVCLQNNAIERLKNVLTSDIDTKVQVKYISSPRYEIIVCDNSKLVAEELIKSTISKIKNNCDKYGVNFVKYSDILIQKDKTFNFSSH